MNDHDAPTRELFARIGARESRVLKDCLEIATAKGDILWWSDLPFPTADERQLDNVEKLRAACLLLGIPWPIEKTRGETCRG